MKGEIPYRAAGTFTGVSYIEREADRLLLKAIQQNQRYPYIVAPRQHGKSSLLIRARGTLGSPEYTTAYVDISTFDVSDYEGFWRSLLEEIAESAKLDVAAINPRRPEVTFGAWLDQTPARIVVFIDEIDSLIGATFCDQFFSKLRSLFNKRAEDPKLGRLLVVLAGAVHPTRLIKDHMRSPFNVGIEVKLDDLTLARVRELVSHLVQSGASVADGVAERVHAATGGSVYLGQLILERLWGNTHERIQVGISDVEAVIDYVVVWAEREVHFLNIYQLVVGNQRLLAALRELGDGLTIEGQLAQDLRLTGVSDGVTPFRNEIYQRVFGGDGPLKLLKRSPLVEKPSAEHAVMPGRLLPPPVSAFRAYRAVIFGGVALSSFMLVAYQIAGVIQPPPPIRDYHGDDASSPPNGSASSDPALLSTPPGLLTVTKSPDGGVAPIPPKPVVCPARNPSCASAGDFTFSVAPGGQQDVSGVLDASNDDYFTVIFTDVPGPGHYYHPKIDLTDSAHGLYTLQIENSCGAGSWCGKNVSTLEMMFSKNPNGCLTAGNCADKIPRSKSWVVHVTRAMSNPTGCVGYTVHLSNI